MQSNTGRRSAYGAILFFVLFVAMLVLFQGSAQAPTAGVVKRIEGLRLSDSKNPADQPKRNLPGTFRWNILENQRVIVDARTYAPGERTDVTGTCAT